MKHLLQRMLLALSLAALCTTLSVAQIQRTTGQGKIVLTTAQGQTEYKHRMLSTIADFGKQSYGFYFKVAGFTAGNSQADNNLYDLMDARGFQVITFNGHFAKPFVRPSKGKTGKAELTGVLQYKGKQITTSLTATSHLKGDQLILELPFDLEPEGTEISKSAASKLGVKTPIHLTITAAY